MIYSVLIFTALVGIVGLGVDYGRIRVAKSELQSAADAAARYAAAGLQNSLFGSSAAVNNAQAVVDQNRADGRAIVFNTAEDVEIGIWNTTSRTFTPTTTLSLANAVRVTARCVQARGSAVPMAFAAIIGVRSQDITAQSIAMIDYSGISGGAGNGAFEYYIPATSNPWLSGMPAGTVANANNPHNNPDYAGQEFVDSGAAKQTVDMSKDNDAAKGKQGKQSRTDAGSNMSNWAAWGDYAPKKSSPITAGAIRISPGTSITFAGINGGANNFSGGTTYDADGNTGWIASYLPGAENGIADILTPGNSIIAVFLNDTQPNKAGAVPNRLDFSTRSSRDFTSLSPQLRQPFFIGDGRTSRGEPQQFVVPAGATRMFLGTMDSFEWSNNVGGFNLTAHSSGRVATVR